MHVDNTLRNLQLAFALRDLVSDMTLEVKSNLDIRTLADQEQLVVADEFALKVEFKVRRPAGRGSTGEAGRRSPHEAEGGSADWFLAYHSAVVLLRSERQMNFCRGLVSAVLEELFECIRDVHREREIELEHQSREEQGGEAESRSQKPRL
jgi:hypothetical protein